MGIIHIADLYYNFGKGLFLMSSANMLIIIVDSSVISFLLGIELFTGIIKQFVVNFLYRLLAIFFVQRSTFLIYICLNKLTAIVG